MRKPTAKQVVTRGTPDMREPQGKAPIHMMQKDFSEYSHPGVIEKIKQDTALDKSARQSTIFDNTQRRQDPERIMEEFPGMPITYSPPGQEFMSRATKNRPSHWTRPRAPDAALAAKAGLLKETKGKIEKDIGEARGKPSQPASSQDQIMMSEALQDPNFQMLRNQSERTMYFKQRFGIKSNEHAKMLAKSAVPGSPLLQTQQPESKPSTSETLKSKTKGIRNITEPRIQKLLGRSPEPEPAKRGRGRPRKQPPSKSSIESIIKKV
jgi:hypothetical protein